MSLLGHIVSGFAEMGVNKGSFIIENNITLVAPMINDYWMNLVDKRLENPLAIKRSPIRETISWSSKPNKKFNSGFMCCLTAPWLSLRVPV